ncbi:MAG: NUDIX domain-containing protein [Patescibacteria group bacterium]|nr:NUDIX domain-containing protein [Patescibacteria group bacterium]
MKQIVIINPEGVSDKETLNYKTREASRAVVFDDEKNVALLHATKYDYYKLPGGGIEKNEDPEKALRRECLEEIGCDVEIVKALGTILEYRKKFDLKQTSHCYIAKVVGEKGIPHLMEDEIEEGFQTVWLPIREALDKVSSGERKIYEAQYMIARDTMILKKAVEAKVLY